MRLASLSFKMNPSSLLLYYEMSEMEININKFLARIINLDFPANRIYNGNQENVKICVNFRKKNTKPNYCLKN